MKRIDSKQVANEYVARKLNPYLMDVPPDTLDGVDIQGIILLMNGYTMEELAELRGGFRALVKTVESEGYAFGLLLGWEDQTFEGGLEIMAQAAELGEKFKPGAIERFNKWKDKLEVTEVDLGFADAAKVRILTGIRLPRSIWFTT